jgi:putative nucleotidyltransferase with HDIG domain
LVALFARFQPGEQAHSLKVYRALLALGETDPNLLAGALLHDIGKIRYPLHLWERAVIVLAKAIAPGRARRWGLAPLRWWNRAFVIAEQHPAWGAELAAGAGAPPMVIELIHRHQTPPAQGDDTRLSQWLHKLQTVDDAS